MSAALREVAGEFPVEAAAGLSLGEWTAHAAGGTFDFATGLKLVETRGRLMDAACESTAGAMAAMIGADETSVRALAADTDVDVATSMRLARSSFQARARGSNSR